MVRIIAVLYYLSAHTRNFAMPQQSVAAAVFLVILVE
jgi:hypothetical protein